MPSVTLRHEIDTDEDTYWSKIVFDEKFNKEMYEGHLKLPSWKLLEMNEDDARITRRVHVEPDAGNLPGPVKKVIGDKLSYVEEGTFDKKAKRYSFKVRPSALPDKTKISGEMWVEKLGDKKIARIAKMDVEVKVMLVGGMVEERILSDLRLSYDKGTSFTNQFIKDKGL
ncbi:MAG: DUF2505 family protein [Deltaproteobacteria bacterium]|nr:DUF2505 family protein [Deltaproteobacteria bacterium]